MLKYKTCLLCPFWLNVSKPGMPSRYPDYCFLSVSLV